jgi:hypothetical protein
MRRKAAHAPILLLGLIKTVQAIQGKSKLIAIW